MNERKNEKVKEIIKEIRGLNVIEYEKTNIYIIENLIDDSQCKKFINFIEKLPLKKIFYAPGNNVPCYVKNLDELLDLNDEFFYLFPNCKKEYNEIMKDVNKKDDITSNYLNGFTKEDLLEYKNEFNQIMQKVGEIMQSVNNSIDCNYNSGYILRKIYGNTRLHSDGINEIQEANITFVKENHKGNYKMIRNTTVIISLNDDYEGGNFNFPYYDISIRLKKGSILLFPPFWTHTHSTDDLLNDTFRYTITTWTCNKIL